MQSALLSIVAVLCAFPTLAQTRGFSQFSGFETTEAPGRALLFLSYAEGRWQTLERGLGDNRTRVLTSLATRIDSTFTYATFSGTGRTWSSFVMSFAHGTATPSATFSSNIQGKATSVFSGKVTWPSQRPGTKGANPSPWGGKTGAFRYRCRQPYAHRSRHGLVVDIQTRGGTLQAGAWGSFFAQGYAFDSVPVTATTSSGSFWSRLPRTPSSCNDSTWTFTVGAYTHMTSTVFGNKHPTRALRGQIRTTLTSTGTAPNRTEVHAVGIGIPGGVPIGARCNRLYVNLAAPALLVPVQHGAGATSMARSDLRTWIPPLAGLRVVHQCAWSNTSDNSFSLTQASQHQLPLFRPDDRGARYSTQHFDPNSRIGIGLEDSGTAHPLFFYESK